MKNLLLIITLIISAYSYASPHKDANGNYMVKSITWVYNDEKSDKFEFSYNALNEIVKVEHTRFYQPKYRETLSRLGSKIIYKKLGEDGKQDADVFYEYVLDDNGQINFVSCNNLGGGSQWKVQNDYYYEDGRLVYGEYHEYLADNLTDKPKLHLDSFHSMNYDYPDGNIWAINVCNYKRQDGWSHSEGSLPQPNIEYWDILNNTNIEPSALYFEYAPYPIGGSRLAFLAGWMKLRSAHLVSKFGDVYHRTRLEYKLDEYDRPIEIKNTQDIEKARFADTSTAYRIEYIDD